MFYFVAVVAGFAEFYNAVSANRCKAIDIAVACLTRWIASFVFIDFAVAAEHECALFCATYVVWTIAFFIAFNSSITATNFLADIVAEVVVFIVSIIAFFTVLRFTIAAKEILAMIFFNKVAWWRRKR